MSATIDTNIQLGAIQDAIALNVEGLREIADDLTAVAAQAREITDQSNRRRAYAMSAKLVEAGHARTEINANHVQAIEDLVTELQPPEQLEALALLLELGGLDDLASEARSDAEAIRAIDAEFEAA